MKLLSSIIYGIIQGLTEFLPVSSSGHLAIIQALTGENTPDAVAFNVLLHAGTLIAVLIAYRKTIVKLVPAFFTMFGKLFRGRFRLSDYSGDERFVILAIISTLFLIPAALLDNVVAFISGYVIIVGAILIFNGVVLFMSDRLTRGETQISGANPLHAVIIGICQMCAILPGLSRSGSTITGGLLCGFKREDAVKYSFILSIPAIIGACVFELPDLFTGDVSGTQLMIYAAGAAVAAVVGFFAIKLLQMIARRSNFRPFAYYCWAVGAAAVVIGFIQL